jgi:hypothetical protein
VRFGATLLVATLGVTHPAGAKSDSDRAGEHFDRAMELVERRQYARAIVELKRAHALSPHPTVLYNLAEAHAAAGGTLRALELFERYREALGSDPDGAEARRVAARIDELERRVASVDVRVHPPSARFRIDDGPEYAGETRLRVAPGNHRVVVHGPGGEAQSLELTLGAGERRTLLLQAPRPAPVRSAVLTVVCSLPDVQVALGDARLGTSERLATGWSHALGEGEHRVTLSRPGYADQVVTARVVARRETVVACELEPVRLDAESGAHLQLRTQPDGARVGVDGREFAGQWLPPGRHRLRVTRPGHEPIEREVTLEAGETHRLDVILKPTPDHAARRDNPQSAQRAQRYWGIGLGALGAALGGTAVGFYVHGRNQRDTWQERQLVLNADWAEGDPQSGVAERQIDNDRLRESFHRWNKSAIGFGVAGATLIAGGAVMYLLGAAGEDDAEIDVALGASPRIRFRVRF